MKNKKSLLESHPEIAAQWHPIKNSNLKPEDFTYGTDKKFWWKCPKGSDYEWYTSINSRTNMKSGCPYCSGSKASKNNNLKVKFPKIANEWHPTKNKSLKSHNVT